MTTPADFTTRARTEMFGIFTAYQALQRRVQDLQDEVQAGGGLQGVYGEAGVNFPDQPDGFAFNNMVAAFNNLSRLVGTPTNAEKNTLIRCRRE